MPTSSLTADALYALATAESLDTDGLGPREAFPSPMSEIGAAPQSLKRPEQPERFADLTPVPTGLAKPHGCSLAAPPPHPDAAPGPGACAAADMSPAAPALLSVAPKDRDAAAGPELPGTAACAGDPDPPVRLPPPTRTASRTGPQRAPQGPPHRPDAPALAPRAGGALPPRAVHAVAELELPTCGAGRVLQPVYLPFPPPLWCPPFLAVVPPYWPPGHARMPAPFPPLPPMPVPVTAPPAPLRRAPKPRHGFHSHRAAPRGPKPVGSGHRVSEICADLAEWLSHARSHALLCRPDDPGDGPSRASAAADDVCPACRMPYPGTPQAAALPVGCMSLHAFGSAVNGFADATSDVDVTLCVQLPGRGACTAHDHCVAWLCALAGTRGHPHFVAVEVVGRARIPRLCLTHRRTGCAVDVTINNLEPLSNTYLLRAYAMWAPALQALGVYVKCWAKVAGVCGAADGFLSPYTLVLLAIFFLQVADAGAALPSLQQLLPGYAWEHGPPPEAVLWALRCTYSAACAPGPAVPELFLRFCAFYLRFPWQEEVVSVRLGRRVRRGAPEVARLQTAGAVLCIEDPFQLHQNLGLKLWRGRQQADFFAAVAAAACPSDGGGAAEDSPRPRLPGVRKRHPVRKRPRQPPGPPATPRGVGEIRGEAGRQEEMVCPAMPQEAAEAAEARPALAKDVCSDAEEDSMRPPTDPDSPARASQCA